ncbi:MAG: response regulator [Alphaproteobacteria bacterium]|nr:response regulator [Alphaproteobacteria bacterium]
MARILIAEDQADVREFCRRGLAAHGHEVAAVEDGLAALAALESERFELLLTDIVMPELDGIALALKAGKTWPDMAILLMTGYAAERQRAHNLDALVHEVLAKPFELSELAAAVGRALASVRPSDR